MLHRADKPNLYHGLPKTRKSAKPLSSERRLETARRVRFGRDLAAASVFHYVGVPARTVRKSEDDNPHEEKRRGAQMKRRDTIVCYTAPERINH